MSHIRHPLRIALLAAAFTALTPIAFANPAQTRALHDAAIVIDAHADVPSPSSRPNGADTIDAGTQIDLTRLRAGGVDAVFVSVFVEQGQRTRQGYAAARREADAKLTAIRDIAARHPADVVIALTAEDVERAAATGKTAIVISLLNAFALGQDPARIQYFYDRGVRVLGLTHAGNNDFADSSRPQARDTPNEHGGLSPLGRQAIAAANRLGILVDVSQLSTPAFLQAVAASEAPVIASHSSIRALVDSPRNLNDEELDAIRQNGGVVAINAFNAYLREFTPEQRAEIASVRARYVREGANGYEGLSWAQREALARDVAAVTPRATLRDFADHIEYAVHRLGIDHVAISSDFNHGGGIEGWADASETANITAELRRRGYRDDDIRKLLGGNVLRVLREAQARATRTS